MKAEEIVKALRSCVNHNTWPPDCESCPLFREKLCVQQMLEGAADFIESLQAQLAESQRRERAAVEDLIFACGKQPSVNDDCSICDICAHKKEDGSCPKQCFMNSLGGSNRWQWRGPQEAGEGGIDE